MTPHRFWYEANGARLMVDDAGDLKYVLTVDYYGAEPSARKAAWLAEELNEFSTIREAMTSRALKPSRVEEAREKFYEAARARMDLRSEIDAQLTDAPFSTFQRTRLIEADEAEDDAYDALLAAEARENGGGGEVNAGLGCRIT